MPPRYLAIHPLAGDATPDDVRASLERVAYEAAHHGLRAVDTLYSIDHGRAYTLVEAATPADVHAAYARAGLHDVEVVPGDRVFTDVLFEPSAR